MQLYRTFCCLLLAVVCLHGCVSTNQPRRVTVDTGSLKQQQSLKPPYYKIANPIQCVPFARQKSGIEIYGNAYTWWRQARFAYDRGSRPRPGAVMVLSKTSKLVNGHVAVVTRVIDSRHIEVTHSNWGGDRKSRSIIYNTMRVKDVSPDNSWSAARFWDYPSGTFGSVYPVSGFIYGASEGTS